MKLKISVLFLLMSAILSWRVEAQQIEYLTAQPLSEVVTANLEPVNTTGKLQVPLITWGGDVATIYTSEEGIFAKEGLDVDLFVENDFTKQVNGVVSGNTPYLRGTLGMINAAAEALKGKGLDIVVIYQLTWSTGGDAIVVRSNKKPSDINTIGVQLYGPHMDYSSNVLVNAKGSVSVVKFKWLRELTLPTYDTKKIIDPVSAFQNDNTLDAVTVIIPDALMLTSGGKIGKGGDGSVKGAKILLTTKTASRVISDVYAVRSDYYASHREEVWEFVHALMVGNEKYADFANNKAQNQAKFSQLMSKSATMLLGAPQASADVEGMTHDCEFVGYDGNVAFFTGVGTTRSLKTLNNEIQTSFIKMGLMKNKVPILSAEWDYSKLATGLKYANISVSAPKFDQKKVELKVAQQINAESEDWENETLFTKEINFAPNQENFGVEEYADDFEVALKLVETNNGALVTVEGHSDPLGILKAKEKKENPQVVSQMQQIAKNLSYNRSKKVLESFIGYAKKKGIKLDQSQFVAVGLGISSPKYNPPRTKEEWAANRRVVFRIKNVEAEADEFSPLSAGGK